MRKLTTREQLIGLHQHLREERAGFALKEESNEKWLKKTMKPRKN